MEQRDLTMTRTAKAALGEKLKQARERKSLTIDQVQKQTKIYSNVIIALEEGRCDEVVPALYVKSFLKKYAQFLGLDPAEAAKEYGLEKERIPERELIKERPEKQAAARQPIQTIRQMPSGPPLNLMRFAGLAVLALAVIFTVTFIGKKAVSAFKRPRIVVRGGPSAAVIKNSSRPSSTAGSAAWTKAARPFTLVLKVKEPVWVEVKKDGEELYKRVLPRGTVETYKPSRMMEFYIAKPASVEIVVDGKRVKLPAKGVLKHLEVTKKGVAW